MMQAQWLRSLAVTLVVALVAVSCGVEETEDPRIAQVKTYADECRTQLAAGNYEHAKNAAYNVVKGSLLSVNDVVTEQAAFCYTTANTLSKINEVTKNIESQLGLVAGLLNGNGGGLSLSPQGIHKLADDYLNGRLDKQTQGAIGLFLDSYLGPIQSLLEENQELLKLIIAKKRFQWQIDSLPLKIADKELINAAGRYDMGEVYLLYGLTRAILATFYTVQSQDYSINLTIVQYALTVNADAGVDNPLLGLMDNPARALVNAVAVLMGTSPKFLALDSRVGTEKMKSAGEGFADGFDSILKAVNAMKKRPDAVQAEHIVEFKRENDQDYFVLHMKFTNLVPLVDLQKFDGISIPLREDVLASLENLAKDFSGASGVNTNLQRDIFPIIALVAVVLINSGAFQELINLATGTADAATQETIDKALSLVASNPDFILAALVGVVPVEIECDFGHIFKNPVGLRDVFPAWVQPDAFGNDLESLKPLTTSTIVYSYECVEDTDPIQTGDLLCPTATDKDHFQPANDAPYVYRAADGSTWVSPQATWHNFPGAGNFGTLWDANTPSPKDGIQTGIPYIGWKDASFGGLVYLDVTTINVNGDIAVGNGLKKATLQSFNATIASIVSQVESFIK